MPRRAALREALARAGVAVAAPGAEAPLCLVQVATFDAEVEALLDVQGAACRVIVAWCGSPEALRRHVWDLVHAGASDVLNGAVPAAVAGAVAARCRRWHRIERQMRAPLVRDNLVGASRAWRRALRQVIEAAQFSRAPVLITGESGTGKELAARLLHTLDPETARDDLVVLDCTTVVPELSGSEFFGHEKGAFTGAARARDGAFALADGGTLFLDEIGDLPLPLQAELLRVVQEKTYKRVGSHTWRSTRFRLVCATHRPLRRMATDGAFRHDLYHRLAAWTIRLPPLCERREDIPRLARHALKAIRPDDPPALDPLVEAYLVGRDYPGNVRELRQLMERMAGRHVGDGPLTVGDIPEEELPARGDRLRWRADRFRQIVRQALACGVGLKEIGRLAGEVAVEVRSPRHDARIHNDRAAGGRGGRRGGARRHGRQRAGRCRSPGRHPARGADAPGPPHRGHRRRRDLRHPLCYGLMCVFECSGRSFGALCPRSFSALRSWVPPCHASDTWHGAFSAAAPQRE
jgi:DNA-binding NtrC family response regulator